MPRLPLLASISATVANGVAVGRLTPGVAGSSWTVRRMITSTTLGPDVPCDLKVYRNVISEATKLDGTSSAGQDTSEIPDGIPLAATETLIAVWSGVANGTICTFTVSGDNDTGR